MYQIKCEKCIMSQTPEDPVWRQAYHGPHETLTREFPDKATAQQWLEEKRDSLQAKGWGYQSYYPEICQISLYLPIGDDRRQSLFFRTTDEAEIAAFFPKRNQEESNAPPAPTGTVETCEKCHGTGRYRWGVIENGKASNEGPCYACGGKGTQNDHDRKRNHYYWIYGVKVSASH